LRSFEGIVPKGTDWRSLGAAPAQNAIQQEETTPRAERVGR